MYDMPKELQQDAEVCSARSDRAKLSVKIDGDDDDA